MASASQVLEQLAPGKSLRSGAGSKVFCSSGALPGALNFPVRLRELYLFAPLRAFNPGACPSPEKFVEVVFMPHTVG